MFKKIAIVGAIFGGLMLASNLTFAADTPPSINFGSNIFNSNNETPPGLELEGNLFTPNTSTGTVITGSGAVQITQASAYPPAFNPSNGEKTTFTYKLSGNAVVALDILDGSDAIIVTLVDDESVLGNQEVDVDWDGTDSATGSGVVVIAGNYKYQIIAKDAVTLQMQSVATGYVQVASTTDFETPVDVTDTGYTDVTLHNAPPTNTSGTGPEMLVFLLFPLAGYLATRKSRNR